MEPRERGERGGKAALRKKARDERYVLAHPQEVEPQPPAEPAIHSQPQSGPLPAVEGPGAAHSAPVAEDRVWETSPYHVSDLNAHWAENPLLQQANSASAAAGSGDVSPSPGAAPSAPVADP